MDANSSDEAAPETAPESTPAPTAQAQGSFGAYAVNRPEPASRRLLPGAPRTEVWLCALALVLAVLFDLLTRDRQPGIGLTITLSAVALVAAALHGRGGLRLGSRNRFALVGAIMVLAACFTWRDSSALHRIDAAALVIAVLVLAARLDGRRLRDARVSDMLVAAVELPIATIARTWFVLARRFGRGDGEVEGAAGESRSFLKRHLRDIVIGCLIAIPILAVFIALLAASDAGFKQLISDVFDFGFVEVVSHIWFVLWVTLGVLLALVAVLASAPTSLAVETEHTWAGPAVIWIVLGSTSLLFTTFVGLQASYLFGGDGYLEEKTGLTAAEYARHGFFELLVVAGLTVALILGARLTFTDRRGCLLAYRWLAPVLSVLTIVLLGSAFGRLVMYADRFGLTVQRILAVAILVWIAAVLAWVAVRVGLGKQLNLGAWAACTALVVVVGLNVANPEALAARTLLERADDQQGDASPRLTDIDYLLGLSPDAVPTIVSHLDRLPAVDRREAVRRLNVHGPYARDGWRSWNLSRSRADDAVASLSD